MIYGGAMKVTTLRTRDEDFRRLMRLLVEAKGASEKLRLPEVVQMVDMAVLGVASEWTETDPATACDAKLEAVVKDCLRRAAAKGARNHAFQWEERAFGPPPVSGAPA